MREFDVDHVGVPRAQAAQFLSNGTGIVWIIEPYLAQRDTLALCICLVDTNIPPQANDTQLITYLKMMQRPFLVVGTKVDRLSNNELAKSIAALKKAHEVDEILPVSSKTDAGTKLLWANLMGAAE